MSEPPNGLPTIPPPRIPQTTYQIPWSRLHEIIRDVTRQFILLEQSLTNQGLDRDWSAIHNAINRFNNWAYEHEVYSYPQALESRLNTYSHFTLRDLIVALYGMQRNLKHLQEYMVEIKEMSKMRLHVDVVEREIAALRTSRRIYWVNLCLSLDYVDSVSNIVLEWVERSGVLRVPSVPATI
ncbi:uncharacterized protein BDV14DRAFT_205140 [Aspergillus stella-maris]|uniref:uncharacterized protein n=1 Tax=Aspergillus stella-maris TaxID=1810926 RepID=UPI003CCDD819